MLGTLLGGRYKITAILGAGGFGQTYMAEDTERPGNPLCVVKQFKPASQDSRFLEVARRLFHTEVETLRRLGQHDRIPELYGFFEEDQEFYLAQEFIDGTPLSDEFIRNGRLSEADIIELLKDVLATLEFVHTNRVIHRDIKPANLIRRKSDGKIVLIDFGAVKEIQTQLVGESGQSSFTVGIGTQGYTPAEQLAGKPRFCSDIYALGITAIQGLTGLQPSQLGEDPDDSELMWREHVTISPGLEFILDRMVRYHYSQRYQSAADVLTALQRMSELPTDITQVSPSLLLPEALLRQETFLDSPYDWRSKLKQGLKVVAIASVAIGGLVLGMRQLGGLQGLELAAYDQMVRLRPELAVDPRLLIVEISEPDLRTLQRATPSDEDVAKVLANLQEHEPRVIGLDLYRDLPQDPGREQLLAQLEPPNVIAITNLGNPPNSDKVPPPPGVPPERVGFNDIPIDPDGIVRRNLLFASIDGTVYHSFALRLALSYLEKDNILPRNSRQNPDYIEVNNVTFPILQPNDGSYQGVDSAGYQILLNYRASQVAQQVSFTDVLAGNIDPDLVRDKVVLIGTTAQSSRDVFGTPYSAGQEQEFKMAGVVVHAQMVSQLLSTVLDGRPLVWFFPDWLEGVWIVGWAVVGGSLAWWMRHPVLLATNSAALLVVLTGGGMLLFLNHTWVPVVAPAIAFIATNAAVTAYRSHRTQQEKQVLTQMFWKDRPMGSLSRPNQK
ncbi:CHASE2 domain-containing protein [Oscillatoria sp. FACHB-1407]|uniref:CHASE2 domain-containing protein n=1 Tax=Oscillatoria sp. FACHB-1407 TaxID=2692847 RepID=UPI001686B8C9|nr:CHASE2 domain-containing protein [Oscillatoria sp. FACHB-1407]MBD2464190.1 CHASE2 domain-containing protein [Oscillatoria sp. FACHB-1407]